MLISLSSDHKASEDSRHFLEGIWNLFEPTTLHKGKPVNSLINHPLTRYRCNLACETSAVLSARRRPGDHLKSVGVGTRTPGRKDIYNAEWEFYANG